MARSGYREPTGMAEKYHQKTVDLIQQAVPEPITTAAVFQRKGQMGAILTGGFAAGAGLVAHGDAKKAAPGFPENTILGVSATQLYAFKVKAGFSWKLKEPVGIWDRSAVQITATPARPRHSSASTSATGPLPNSSARRWRPMPGTWYSSERSPAAPNSEAVSVRAASCPTLSPAWRRASPAGTCRPSCCLGVAVTWSWNLHRQGPRGGGRAMSTMRPACPR